MTQRNGYCSRGPTVRLVRTTLADELLKNPAAVALVEKAAGGDNLISSVDIVSWTGQGPDLRLRFYTSAGEVGFIWLDVQIDELRGQERRFLDEGVSKVVRRGNGLWRNTTIAPKIWFDHVGNAESAVNPLTFESLLSVASGNLAQVLYGGLDRAEKKFTKLRRPKREIPYWRAAQSWR